MAAVIGLGFGDEGKGKAVSTLVPRADNPLVIRFCGGQQAGHKVTLCAGDPGHVFSNFGSGTLQGAPTYWSRYCTFDPVGVIAEWRILKDKGITPVLYVDEACPITTHADKLTNRVFSKAHGTCGVGVGQTIQREEDHYHLHVSDLFNRTVLKIKAGLIIEKYYAYRGAEWEDYLVEFIRDCEDVKDIITTCRDIPYQTHDSLIFEGSQGILLDQNIGFFPHVTRSNTGIKNIIDMQLKPDVLFVTRAYQTRHGTGPMTNQHWNCGISSNPHEHNKMGEFQGPFRTSILDLDLLRYARSSQPVSGDLLITCLDVMEDYQLTVKGKIKSFSNELNFVNEIRAALPVNDVHLSWSPYPDWETLS